ncbi:MAG: hypothetical protein IPP13_09020 [Kouleothrix sp.]|jgi:hypothetical protein|nr:hypothetical protein [Kouleothrix sp.]
MGEIDERLERGVALFRRAGDDDALLGAALLAFVGALEQFLDADLLARPELAEPDRAQLTQGRLGWARRADLAEQHGLLRGQHRAQVLEAARARVAMARGEACAWDAGEIQAFGRLVANICGRRELVRQIDQRAERARTTAAAAPPAYSTVPPRFPWVRLVATLLFLVALGGVLWVIYQQIDGPRLLGALGALPAPTAEPVPFEIDPSATPVQRRATIVGLGGTPGWLHVTPAFDSPTRAIQLADGMQVTLREQQQVDANNTRWQLIEAGGYEGWCPEANLAIGP